MAFEKAAIRVAMAGLLIALVGAAGCESPAGSPAKNDEASPSVVQTTQALGIAPEPGCTSATYGGHEYWFCPQLRGWSAARSRCEARGYNLVRIEDAAENAFVRERIGFDAWIGANDLTSEGSWRWTFGGSTFWTGNGFGSPVAGLFSNWSLFQPDNVLNQDCAKMSLLDGKWIDDACALPLRYVCESGTDECPTDPSKVIAGTCGCGVSDADSDGDGVRDCQDRCPNDPTKIEPGDCGCSDVPEPAGTPCSDGLCAANTACNGAGVCGNPAACAPPDFFCRSGVFQNTYYWVCDNDRSFADAEQRCRNAGMDLATVESAAEDAFLATKTLEHTLLGATDQATEGDWVWGATGVTFWTGGPTGAVASGAYANWDLGQPTDGLLGNDCVVKDPPLVGGRWETRPCVFADAFACETVHRVEATPAGSTPASPEGPVGAGGIDDTGAVLAATDTTVVRVTPGGTATTVASFSEPRRIAIDPSGTRFGVYTATGFEVRNATGSLIATHPRQPTGYAMLVPDSDLVFIPEMDADEGEQARVTHVRYFDPGGLRSRFAAPLLRISRSTATHLVHADNTTLARTTVDGVESWRIPVALRTFEISRSGSALIGVLKQSGPSQVVQVSLATGAISSSHVLDGPFWNVAISPSGRYSAATTKGSAYLFDGPSLVRRIDLPATWAVSVDVSDLGYVAVGAQEASHAAEIELFGPRGEVTTVARDTTDDGFRPFVGFFDGGAKLLSNEPGGLFAFDVGRAP